MKKKKVLITIAIVLFAVTLAGFIAFSGFVGYMTFTNSTKLSTNEDTDMEHSIAYFESVGFDYSAFLNEYNISSIKIPSSFEEHTIPADYIVSESEDADTVIMIHGLGGNRQTVFPNAGLFLQQGYNVLAYDQRSAGENTAQYSTFGYLESNDTADCVAYLDKLLSSDKQIYIWGVSNGAGTAGLSVRHDIVESRVEGLILDCPISNTRDMIRVAMEDMNLGVSLDFPLFCGNIWNRAVLGFTYDQASTAESLAESNLMVLMLATEADKVTPYWMAEEIHRAAPNTTLVSVKDSPHAEIYFEYPELYKESVLSFLEFGKSLPRFRIEVPESEGVQ